MKKINPQFKGSIDYHQNTSYSNFKTPSIMNHSTNKVQIKPELITEIKVEEK